MAIWIKANLPPTTSRNLRALLRFPRRFVTRRSHPSGRERHNTIHILHIGKTGGTAIKYALEHGLPNSTVTKRVRTISLRTPDYLINMYDHSITLLDIPQGEKVVFFLRDPVKRFISGFYSRKRQGRPYNIPWDRKEAAVFKRFDTPNQLGEALSSPDAALRKEAIRAMSNLKHSKLSYPFWLISEAYLRSRLPDVFFIGFQEQLTADFELLKARLALPQSVALPEGEIESHRSRQTVDTSLTELGRKNLRKWHSIDYQIFRLCQERAKSAESHIPPRARRYYDPDNADD